MFVLLIITVPNNWNASLDDFENWIETSDLDKYYWYFVLFFGFLLVRNRFQKAPKIIKYIVFCVIFVSWFCPIMVIETEGYKSFIWSFGYVIQDKFLRTNWGVYFAYIYLAIVCFPMVTLCSSFELKGWITNIIARDIGWALFCICGNVALVDTIVHEATGDYLNYSLCYVIIPIVFITIIFIWRIYEYNYPSENNENDITFQMDLTDSIN